MPNSLKQVAILIASASAAVSLVIPAGREISSSAQAIQEFYNAFEQEIYIEETSIDIMSLHFTNPSQSTNIQFEEAVDQLVDSELRRTLCREKMVDYIPEDMVIDTPGVEYLAAVGSRYMENVIHNARELKSQAHDGVSVLPPKLLQEIMDDQRKLKALDALMFTTADPTSGKFGTDVDVPLQPDFNTDTSNSSVEVAPDMEENLSFENFQPKSTVERIETNQLESNVVRTLTTSDGGSTETISETTVDRSVIETVTSWN